MAYVENQVILPRSSFILCGVGARRVFMRPYRRISRWEHEAVLDRMQARLDQRPETARQRRQTVEHPFGTLKAWMGATHFLTKTLARVRTEMSLHVLACNLKRVIAILGTASLMKAIPAQRPGRSPASPATVEGSRPRIKRYATCVFTRPRP